MMFCREELQRIRRDAEQKYIEQKYEKWIDEMKVAAIDRKNFVEYENSEKELPSEWVSWLWKLDFLFYGLDESGECPFWHSINDLNVELNAYNKIQVRW